jgi:PKD repeat protein/plastocyanin
MVSAELTFNSTGTGSGFNIYIDGILDSNSPYNYSPNGDNLVSLEIIGDGNQHEILIEDVDNVECNGSVIFDTPFCDDACLLDLNISQEACNDNDEVPLNLTIISQNAGQSGFNIFVDGNLYTGSPFSYNPTDTTFTTIFITGDGNQHEITIQDIERPECSTSQIINVPICTAECLLQISAIQTGGCNAEQEVTFEFTIQSMNTGQAGFNILINNVEHPDNPFQYDPSDTTVFTINLPGDGGTYAIQVIDIDSTECADIINITTPNCDDNCVLEIQTVSINVPQTHIVEVLDFEFLPAEITVEVGDIVRFEWLGVIPHTSTSDAIFGSDVWNSGLLGQGAVYEVTINSSGTHPYYCIPHGAPGGVGMAGVIYADEACDDDSLLVQIMFVSNNEGLNGYNVFLDGTITLNSPISYDPTGIHTFVVEMPGDGLSHEVLVEDVDNSNCSVDTTFIMPDCDNPCFGFDADFDFEINFQTLEVNFTDVSSGTPDSWQWDFGDGEISNEQNPQHVYLNEGVYEVCLIVENSIIDCIDTICMIVDMEQYVCQSMYSYEIENLTVNFTDESVTNTPVDHWTWDLGNGLQIVGQQNPSYTYDTLGIYNVCLTIEADSCVSDTCMLIDLSDPCLSFQPEFSFSQNENNLGVQFLDLSTGNANQWLWGFGDGTTSNDQNPFYEYDEPGNYNVCLLVQDTINGCNASSCESVLINTTGVTPNRLEKRLLVIYPNPSGTNNPSWTVEGILEKDIGKELFIKVYDYQGKTIIKDKTTGEKQITINCSKTISAGIYIIEIRSEQTVYRGRVIAQ